ncbi:MAG: hypothetical protein KC416_02915, partial [Myxococcales bacterium]|nr:hypothetical protein [Myxococcales bacterium]
KAAWGLSSFKTGEGPLLDYSTCHAKSYGGCQDWTPAQTSFVDSLDWVRVHDAANINTIDPGTGEHKYNNCDRYYVDWYDVNLHSQTPATYANCGTKTINEGTQRCVTAGNPGAQCSVDAAFGAIVVPDFSLWIR